MEGLQLTLLQAGADASAPDFIEPNLPGATTTTAPGYGTSEVR